MGKLILPSKPAVPPVTALMEPAAPVAAVATAAAAAPTDSLLLRQLRQFVSEVVQLLDGYAREVPHGDADPEGARRAAEDACDALSRAIDAQTMEIARAGSPSDRAAVDELRYLKAALADELLLSRPWPGRSKFTDCLIETRLFGSSIAGDEIFRRIDLLLNDASGQPSQMAPLYLCAISTGFEGRHRGSDAERSLQPLRDALFRKIYRREPELQPGLAAQPRIADRVASAQAYRHPLSEIEPVRFFRISRNTLLFLLTMLILLALSQAVWRWSTAPLRRALEPGVPAQIRVPAPSEAGRG